MTAESEGPASATGEALVAIVGAGAAGLVAAIAAAEVLGSGVLVLEATKDAGRKIVVSGGGRCNILPLEDAPSRFVSDSPRRELLRFLSRFPLAEQRTSFEELLQGALHEEAATKKLFPPTQRSRDVRDALVARARSLGSVFRFHARLLDVLPPADAASPFVLQLADGTSVKAGAVILATGGYSVLGGGADGIGIEVARRLGHRIVPPYAALAPLVAEGAPHAFLSGVSLVGRVTAASAASGDHPAERAEATGGFLFTHKGYSGPAALDVSHVVERARAGAEVRLALFPEGDDLWDERLRTAKGTLSGLLRKYMPDRLADALVAAAGVVDGPLARLPREERRAIVKALVAFALPVTGTEGYRTAEVTGGGVALAEVDPGSGQSRRVPGLFLAGELLDSFGPIGGFNFQWAWATGRTAGRAAAERVRSGLH